MSSSIPSDGFDLRTSLARAMHAHWRIFLAEGILLTILGIAAIVLPAVAGVVATILLGWLFVLTGALGIAATMQARGAPGFGWSMLSAVVALLAGIVLLWNPLQGLATLTFVLTAFFIADGLLMIILAIAHRRELTGRWEWLLFNGVIDLVMAAIIIAGFPGSVTWVLGLLVGIDLLFGGASLIAMALAARDESAGLVAR